MPRTYWIYSLCPGKSGHKISKRHVTEITAQRTVSTHRPFYLPTWSALSVFVANPAIFFEGGGGMTLNTPSPGSSRAVCTCERVASGRQATEVESLLPGLSHNKKVLLPQFTHVFCVLLLETNSNFSSNLLFCVTILRVCIRISRSPHTRRQSTQKH